MSNKTDLTPKVFISYSWTSPEHINRIVGWAERLVGDGVDVILDKWELKEGNDKYAFMEQMVTDPSVSKVLIFTDAVYAEKADERKGGVGTESQIISAKIYEKVKQDKFIPIVLEFNHEGKPCLPVYLANRIFIDFTSLEKYHENYEQLLRIIFDKPRFKKPKIGAPPTFIIDGTKLALPTTPKLEVFKDAVINNKPSLRGLSLDYLDSVIENLEELRISELPEGIELDEFVVKSITDLLPLRDEVIEFFTSQAKYKNDPEIYSYIFSFFEQCLKFKGPKERAGTWNDSWADHIDFFINELFIYFISILIKYKRFSEIKQFVEQPYLLPDNIGTGRDGLASFRLLFAPMQTLRYRNNRLKLNRISLKADLIHQRATIMEISFNQFMQADFLLMLFSLLNQTDRRPWYPSSLIYASYSKPFEMFIRATSHTYFVELARLLNVNDKIDLVTRYQEGAKRFQIGNWSDYVWQDVSFEELMNLDRLDSQT